MGDTQGPGPALEVKGLNKTFRARGSKRVPAVREVSFGVQKGEVVGLLGRNGAGKSTIIKCILGLMEPDQGTVEAFGCDVRHQRRQGMALMSAVLEGSRNVYWRLTPWENLEFFASIQGLHPRTQREYLEHLLDTLRLSDRAHSPVIELSQGMKQKVAIACALARRTPLVFLDEPTLGLDVETSFEMRAILSDLVKEEGRTVVLSSHDMKVVEEVCQRVIIIKEGQVVADDHTRNLVSLFRTRAYRLEIHGLVPDGVMGDLNGLVGRARRTGSGDYTELEVEIARPEDLYLLLDVLRDSGLLVEGITRDEPDLERAFLRIVRDEERGGVAS